MRKQAELVASATTATSTPQTPIERAVSVHPREATREIKADVGSTASFNARIASMMAANASTRVDEQQLEVLRQIADNTSDLEPGLA